ncbi:hypothetical protein ACI2IY_03220 [Lysobacter enzymogenes]|uniref:hypothetical protein n=1 Tax=Lysobacter enzymogenes TaxID=69 RepID=UPI00384BB41E
MGGDRERGGIESRTTAAVRHAMVAAARAAGAHRGSFRQAGDVVDTAGADAGVGAFLQRLFHVAMNSRGRNPRAGAVFGKTRSRDARQALPQSRLPALADPAKPGVGSSDDPSRREGCR